jgi:hypothetical protein
MRLARSYALWLALLALALVLAAIAEYSWPDPGDRRLRAFVHARPPVPIVFTSRSEPASLRAAADDGEGFVYPGQPLWQAREGRLRLLKPDGTVHELSWGKPLPDGSTLIDVMSPSVSNDGKRILFAGRKAPPDPGHFRLYEVRLDGSGLRPLTGGPDDPGCSALPPMRYRSDSDHTLLPDDERRRIDYDDIDPVELHFASGRIAFASSRTPDLGRGHSRRSTTLWWMQANGADKRPLTGNRYNDRWPFLLTSNFLAFSLWSHNQEVVTPDERDVRPWEPGMASPRPPVDSWMAAVVRPVGSQFAMLLKPGVPVWRPRPLFNGRFVFQTRTSVGGGRDSVLYEAVQAEPGLVLHAPSSEVGPGREPGALLQQGPRIGPNGEALSRATPSPCPEAHVVLAAMPLAQGVEPDPKRYGIWICRDDWTSPTLSAQEADLKLLFDDPDFVDAEPVAVYARGGWQECSQPAPLPDEPAAIRLSDGTTYHGPAGKVYAASVYYRQQPDAPGQLYPDRSEAYFTAPPEGSINHIRVWASRRDRFDDPVKPRIHGAWEPLLKLPVTGPDVVIDVPSGVPTMLAAFDSQGRVVSWTGRSGADGLKPPRFLALAGDHYSAATAGGNQFCIGCHAGHSGLGSDDLKIRERVD